MRRHGIGIAGLQRQLQTREQYRELGTDVREQQIEQLRKQLETFRSHLEAFARKHRDAIRKDPKFRAHFQTMCDRLGVDPLASNKGFWADIFGVGDFYYELAVQAIEASMKSREADGGLVALDELKRRVIERRGANGANISENDLLKAIRSLKPLGSGMDVIEIGGRCMIRTVPRELSHDETTVLAIAQEHHAQVTVDLLLGKLNWTLDRVETCLTDMLRSGLCWIDEQVYPPVYWIPSLVADLNF